MVILACLHFLFVFVLEVDVNTQASFKVNLALYNLGYPGMESHWLEAKTIEMPQYLRFLGFEHAAPQSLAHLVTRSMCHTGHLHVANLRDREHLGWEMSGDHSGIQDSKRWDLQSCGACASASPFFFQPPPLLPSRAQWVLKA